MRIFSTLAETHQMGVVARLAVNGNYFEIAADANKVLAKVSYQSLLQMLDNGSAICVPTMNWSRKFYRSKVQGTIGGTTILRADYELKDKALWLIPEAKPSLNVLHFVKDEANNIKCKNATLLASVGCSQSESRFHAAELSPGGAIYNEGTFYEQGDPFIRLIAGLSADASTITGDIWRAEPGT